MAVTVDVEVILNEFNKASRNAIKGIVQSFLEKSNVRPNSLITNLKDVLQNDIKALIVGDIPDYVKTYIDFGNNIQINWYFYSLDTFGPVTQSENDEDSSETVISTQLSLPSASLLSLWENLYYDADIKHNLLKYAQTMMEFSDKGVNNNIISCNRVILLHGPPGTGKTSLCKALAQKLTIRMSDRFSSGLLIEINSHSLFSKWFSESGKLVNKMFTKIREIIENSSILVCVLIDEVESLAHARDQCVSGTEPSDSIRVVNAVLTQIDQIKCYPNVLILATSNMTQTIDLAFVDRADIKQYLGLPSVPAICKIYVSCIEELMKTQIIKEQVIEPLQGIFCSDDIEMKHILKVCEASQGLSGRSLRKVPFIAHALFLHTNFASLSEYLLAMEKAIEKEKIERNYFKCFKTETM